MMCPVREAMLHTGRESTKLPVSLRVDPRRAKEGRVRVASLLFLGAMAWFACPTGQPVHGDSETTDSV